MNEESRRRILIIGLDGASPHLVEKWQDSLPHLGRLIERGSFGTLHSSVPPRSIPAWYCLATGMNPAKLGVFGFSQRLPNSYDYTFANFTHCQGPPFWDWLNRYGIETAIIHMPGTFPPRPLHGSLVAGWPAPQNAGNLIYTHPASLSSRIDRYIAQPFEFVSELPILPDNDAVMLHERLRLQEMHGDVAMHVLQNQSWQVALAVLSPLDRASHQFWRHMDAAHPQHPSDDDSLADALMQIYQAADAQVGRLLSLVNEEDWVFVISDHGFGPNTKVFYLNEWLRQEGYLVLRKQKTEEVSVSTRLLGQLAAPLFWLNHRSPLFRRLIEPFKKRTLSNFIRDRYVRAKEDGLVRINHLPVDWERTRAYCPDESSLYLNLRGRDPSGMVESGNEADRLLKEIERGLSGILDPRTGRPLPVQIYRKEEVYEGPFLGDAPDLIVAMDHYQTEVMAEVGFGELFDLDPLRSGTHTPEGLLIACGPGISAGQHHNANLVDIVPTVLHLAGTPVPNEVDGKVILSIFNERFPPRQRRIKYEPVNLDPADSESFSEEEMAQVEKQLRDLGYLS